MLRTRTAVLAGLFALAVNAGWAATILTATLTTSQENPPDESHNVDGRAPANAFRYGDLHVE